MHHPKLNELLLVSFARIDEIEKEYRDFNDKNIVIARNHPNLIKDLFLNYEKKSVVFFDLLDESKRKDIEARNL